jgi:hypothetical protein
MMCRAGAAFTCRLRHLRNPLPDDLSPVELWVQLATEQAFKSGENIEWLDPAALVELAREFEARAGKSWREWAD